MNVPRVLVLACGALAREIRDIARLHDLEGVTLECLPARLHNSPADIPAAVKARLSAKVEHYDRVLVGYADCGTAGALVELCAELSTPATPVELMPGAHCYQFFAGHDRFLARHDADPTAFYLTDYLVKHFERIIMRGLGIAAHPELRDMYFGNYTKIVYLAQTDDPVLDEKAARAATMLGLDFEREATGYGELETQVVEIAR